jgi:hypothetical protein
MASSQRFCLRWNNHQSNLLSVFDQLLHAETFTDVTLAIDGQYLKAHKVLFRFVLFRFVIFSVIRNRVNQVELFIIFETIFFSFVSFVPFFGNKFVVLCVSYHVLCFLKKNVWLRYLLRPRADARKNVSQKNRKLLSQAFPPWHACVAWDVINFWPLPRSWQILASLFGIITEGEDFRSQAW